MASVLSIDLWTIWNNFLSFLPTYLRLAPWLSMEVELLDLQLLAVKLVTCPAWRPTEVANHTSKGHKRKSRNEEYPEMGHPETSAALLALFVVVGCWNPTISRYDWWPIGDDCLKLLWVPRNVNRVLWKPPAGLVGPVPPRCFWKPPIWDSQLDKNRAQVWQSKKLAAPNNCSVPPTQKE